MSAHILLTSDLDDLEKCVLDLTIITTIWSHLNTPELNYTAHLTDEHPIISNLFPSVYLPLYIQAQSQTKHCAVWHSQCFCFRAKWQLWRLASTLCQNLSWCLCLCLTVWTLVCLKSVSSVPVFSGQATFWNCNPMATGNTTSIPSGYLLA